MSKYTRDIILLVKEDNINPQEMGMKIKFLHQLIGCIETTDDFCIAHELVCRNRITNKKFKILDAISQPVLKPFMFLINKN